jgi:hypothetical protein
VVCTGPFARWMHRRGWGAVTLPTWLGTWILYWGEMPAQVAAHEAVHVTQAYRYGITGFWARYWWGLLRHGYRNHPMELEARERSE